MLELPQITLVAMASTDIYATVRALMYSSKNIKFGRILFLSHEKPWYLPSKMDFEYTSKNKDVYEWCYKIVYELYKYINTDYIILVHNDGFIVNPAQWKDTFLDYDYIGAPWPIPENDSYRDLDGNLVRVGNSVSLRSKRILELPSKLNLPWEDENKGNYHEDGFLCCKSKLLLEKYGVKYAPLEVAKYFSHETMIPEIKGIKPFAFHKWSGTNAKYPKFFLSKFLK